MPCPNVSKIGSEALGRHGSGALDSSKDEAAARNSRKGSQTSGVLGTVVNVAFLGGHFVRQRGSPQALCTSSRFYFEQKNHKIKRSHARIALEIQCHGFIFSYLLHRSFLLLILVAMLYKPLLSFQTLFLTCPPVAVFFHP